MPPPGIEPATPASERPQTHALVSAATGIGACNLLTQLNVASIDVWRRNYMERSTRILKISSDANNYCL